MSTRKGRRPRTATPASFYNGGLYFAQLGQSFHAQARRHLAYHRCKYGRPTLIMVNPLDAALLHMAADTFYGCEVKATNSVLPNHTWIGTAVARAAVVYEF